MTLNTIPTYDIPRCFWYRGQWVCFASELWAKMVALVGQDPEIQVITVIRKSATEEKVIGLIDEFGMAKAIR